MGQFLIAALVFVVLIVINVFKPKLGYKVVAIAVIIAIAATFVGIFSLLAAGTTGVQNYMSFLNSIGSNTTYTAVANSYTGPTFDFGATIFMLPFFAIFVYPWLNAGPAVASEIKGKGALRYNVFISSVVTLIVVTAGFASMYYAGGFNFINGALGNANLVFNWSFNFWTLAMGVSSIPAVAWFIGLGLDPVERGHHSLRNHRSITIPLCSILRPIPTREDITTLARSMVRLLSHS